MNRREVLAVFAVSLAVRLGYVAFLAQDPQNFRMPDSSLYEDLADDMLATGGFNHRAEEGYRPETERVPLYVAYLALVRMLFGGSPLASALGQGVLDALTCVVIGLIARQLDNKLFLLAGLLAAFSLNLVVYSAMVLSDSMFLFPYSAGLLFVLKYLHSPSLRYAVFAGVFIGAAILTRAILQYYVPLLVIVLVIAAWRARLKPWPAFGHVAASLLCLLLFVGPLIVRNGVTYGHYALVSQGGTHALNWVVPLARELSAGTPFAQTQKEMKLKLEARLAAEGRSDLSANPFERSQQQLGLAKQEVLAHGVYPLLKAWTLGSAVNLLAPSLHAVPWMERMDRPRFYETHGDSLAAKVWNFLTDPKGRLYLSLMVPAILWTVAIRIVQGAGIFHAVRARASRPSALFLLATAAYVLAVTGPILGIKYRLPLEPILVCFLAVGLACWWERFRGGAIGKAPRADGRAQAARATVMRVMREIAR